MCIRFTTMATRENLFGSNTSNKSWEHWESHFLTSYSRIGTGTILVAYQTYLHPTRSAQVAYSSVSRTGARSRSPTVRSSGWKALHCELYSRLVTVMTTCALSWKRRTPCSLETTSSGTASQYLKTSVSSHRVCLSWQGWLVRLVIPRTAM